MSNPSTGPPPPPPPPFRPVADFISRWPPSSGGRFLPFALPASVNQRFSTPATRRWPRHSHQRAAAQDDRRKLKKKQSKTRKEIYKKNSIKIIQRPRALIAFTPCFSDTNGVIKKKPVATEGSSRTKNELTKNTNQHEHAIDWASGPSRYKL